MVCAATECGICAASRDRRAAVHTPPAPPRCSSPPPAPLSPRPDAATARVAASATGRCAPPAPPGTTPAPTEHGTLPKANPSRETTGASTPPAQRLRSQTATPAVPPPDTAPPPGPIRNRPETAPTLRRDERGGLPDPDDSSRSNPPASRAPATGWTRRIPRIARECAGQGARRSDP